jgi:hypothetical protein
MGLITRNRAGGAALVAAGLIANEVFGWGIQRVLDYIADGLTLAEVTGWPWGGWVSIGLVIIGLALVFWPTSVGESRTDQLWYAADKVAAGFTVARNYSLDPDALTDAIRVGESALVSFRKAGLEVPELSNDANKRGDQLERYFRELLPLLRDGHLREAKNKAKELIATTAS